MIKCKHFGISQEDFDLDRLTSVKNQDFIEEMNRKNIQLGEVEDRTPTIGGVLGNKPQSGTGFWCCRSDTTNGWKEWCEENEFPYCDLSKSMELYIPDTARIYSISCVEDVDYLLDNYSFTNVISINFEKMAEDYDVMEVTTMHNGIYRALYGWDCESILILNPKIIVLKGEF